MRLMILEVTELQGGGIRGRQILYFYKLKAHHPQNIRYKNFSKRHWLHSEVGGQAANGIFRSTNCIRFKDEGPKGN